MNTKSKYNRALLAAALMMQALPASADVIYREIFGNAAAPNSNFLSLTSNWGWVAHGAGGVVMTTGDAGVYNDATSPSHATLLPPVNSGTTGILPLNNGRTGFFGATFLHYTNEFPVNRQLNDITTVT